MYQSRGNHSDDRQTYAGIDAFERDEPWALHDLDRRHQTAQIVD